MTKTVSINNRRHYLIQNDDHSVDYFPSVTTIIGAMTDSSGLDAWRKRIGEKKAEKISKFSANRGTVMHMFNENFLNYIDLEPKERLRKTQIETHSWGQKQGFTDEEIDCGRKLFYNFYHANSFGTIDEVVMQEQMLYSSVGGGYAGRVDLIIRKNDGTLVVADFKTSRKRKKSKWIDNYKMQISAYWFAYWQLTGEKPHHCEIWISNEQDSHPQIFPVYYHDLKENFKRFINLVQGYHQKYSKEIREYKASI